MSHADDFVESKSGLRYFDIKIGLGESPAIGDTCVVHWVGYTEGYQGKRIGNSSIRDEPFEFVIGRNQAIPAFEEACAGMKVGGIRRIQIPGNHPELSYARDRSKRFVSDGSGDSGFFRYAKGPQPFDLGGQRALDFVLDNNTLQDFNRTLLFDVKLLNIRKGP
jgi:FKBP-type peptidyl-prolyl cis-trans isomerase